MPKFKSFEIRQYGLTLIKELVETNNRGEDIEVRGLKNEKMHNNESRNK